MKQKTRGIGVGTISLIMIFSVLCLTIFAVLTLSTSNAEKALADRTSSFVSDYYEADSNATRISARIIEAARIGQFPDLIDGVSISYESEDEITVASYYSRINDVQDLFVKLGLDESRAVVLEWRTVFSGDWETDDSLNVFDPDDFFSMFIE